MVLKNYKNKIWHGKNVSLSIIVKIVIKDPLNLLEVSKYIFFIYPNISSIAYLLCNKILSLLNHNTLRFLFLFFM